MDVLDIDQASLRRILFAAVYLPTDCPHYWEVVSKFAGLGTGSKIDAEKVKIAVENMQLLNERAFSTDKALALELQNMTYDKCEPLGIVLVPPNQVCLSCGGKLLLRGDRPSRLVIYTESEGTVLGSHFQKFCQNYRKGCSYTQHYGYHTMGDKSVSCYEKKWNELPYFVSTSQTAFELKLLRRFDVELLIGELSYKQKSEIYNYLNGYEDVQKKCSSLKHSRKPVQNESELVNRMKLDRRRLEAGHMRYAILNVCDRYPDMAGTSPSIASDVNITLRSITQAYYDEFTRKYAAHACKIPGCQTVIVLDGNMKNRRHICNARDAGYIEYPGLPGRVKTGCMSTPQYESRYCSQHQLHVCKFDTYEEFSDDDTEQDNSDDNNKSETLRVSKRKKEGSGEPVVEMLLQKKELRDKTLYKVLWLGQTESKCTWMPAEALPAKAVREFEEGLLSEAVQHCHEAYGMHTTTLLTNTCEERPTKRPHISRPTIDSTTGVFQETNDQSQCASISCNTLKDKNVLKTHRSAGILAGMWPCGIITFVSELFIAESNTQVYGALHSFFRLAPATATNIKYVCYDDGCHLRRFARNSKRSQVSKESAMIAEKEIVVDKMHMKGHTDSWCKTNCDPHKHVYLNPVDTEVCEQTFSWFSKYSRITQSMSQYTFIFFILYVCDLHNIREEEKLQRGSFL